MGEFGTGKYVAFLLCLIIGIMLILFALSGWGDDRKSAWDAVTVGQFSMIFLTLGILLIILSVIFLRKGYRILGRWASGGFKESPGFWIAVIIGFIGFILLAIGFVNFDLKLGGIGIGLILLGGFIFFVAVD